jgi:hypothetical protein
MDDVICEPNADVSEDPLAILYKAEDWGPTGYLGIAAKLDMTCDAASTDQEPDGSCWSGA